MGIGLQGAFGNDALFSLLHQRKMEQMQAAQQAFENQRRLAADQRAQQGLDLQAKMRQDQLAEQTRQHNLETQDRQIGLANNLAEQIPGGTFLPQSDPAVGMLRTGGRGSLLTAQPAQPALPEDFQGPLPEGQARTAMPSGFIKTTTTKQREASTQDALKQSQAESRLQQMQDQLGATWERLRLQGDSNDLRGQLAKQAADLAQARLELERQKAAEAASKMPQPQFFNDANGATHAVIFDKGQFKEVPLPKGYTPTKAAPPGFFDKIKTLFNPSDSGPTDYSNPNWGKP